MVLRPLCISSTTLCIFLLLLPCHFCHSCHVFFYCVSCVYAYPTLYEGCGLLGLHHSLLFPYDLRWCVGKSPYSSNRWASTLIVYFCAMSVGLLAYWVHYLFPWASPLQIEPTWGGGSESRSWQWMRSSYRPVVQHPFILFGGALWLFASSSRPCSTISRMTWSRSFLGSIGFLHPRSCHSSRRCFTHAYPLWIWVRYITRLEGVGGQGAFRYGLHGWPSTGRCIEGHSFFLMSIPLPWFVQPPPLGPLVV